MGERVGRAGAPGSHSARASSIQRWRSSGTNRSGPSRPPMRIEGMRPALAASYSQVRETPSRAATSAGLRRSGVLICWLLTWVIDRERPKTANEFCRRRRQRVYRDVAKRLSPGLPGVSPMVLRCPVERVDRWARRLALVPARRVPSGGSPEARPPPSPNGPHRNSQPPPDVRQYRAHNRRSASSKATAPKPTQA